MSKKITIEDSIEFFIDYAIPAIMNEDEVPKCNFVFNQEALDWLYDMKNIASLSINTKNLEMLKKQDDPNCPTMYIKNHMLFFSYLTEIATTQLRLYEKHGEQRTPFRHLRYLIRRIWLRMGINDFNNVENFLNRQLAFVQDETFDDYRFETDIADFYNHRVTAISTANCSWDESTRSMKFKIYDGNKYHSLPHIFYDIVDKTCYIYAVQNDPDRHKLPKVERLLYKLNKGIENPNIHPSMVYSMKLFIDLLKEKGIDTIKVPTLQVLSYRYHEILSTETKENFKKEWPEERVERIKEGLGYAAEIYSYRYERAKIWYDHVVDKEDVISRLKTENLINLVYRVIDTDDSLALTSDIDIDDSLTIKVNNKVKRK